MLFKNQRLVCKFLIKLDVCCNLAALLRTFSVESIYNKNPRAESTHFFDLSIAELYFLLRSFELKILIPLNKQGYHKSESVMTGRENINILVNFALHLLILSKNYRKWLSTFNVFCSLNLLQSLRHQD